MRGAVSLAAALALPLTARLPGARPDLFLTFCVILATLVGQGLTLPWLDPAARVVAAHRRRPRGGDRPAGRRRRGDGPARRAGGGVPRAPGAGRPARGPYGHEASHVPAACEARATRRSRSCSTTSRSATRSWPPSARPSSSCATRGHRRRGAPPHRARPRPRGAPRRGSERRVADGTSAHAARRRHARLRDHEHRRRRALPVHVRIGDRRPPGQDVRPGLRRDPRRDHPRGPECPRRVRDGHHDRARPGPRRDLDHDLRRLPGDRPRHRPRHRLHARPTTASTT